MVVSSSFSSHLSLFCLGLFREKIFASLTYTVLELYTRISTHIKESVKKSSLKKEKDRKIQDLPTHLPSLSISFIVRILTLLTPSNTSGPGTRSCVFPPTVSGSTNNNRWICTGFQPNETQGQLDQPAFLRLRRERRLTSFLGDAEGEGPIGEGEDGVGQVF